MKPKKKNWNHKSRSISLCLSKIKYKRSRISKKYRKLTLHWRDMPSHDDNWRTDHITKKQIKCGKMNLLIISREVVNACMNLPLKQILYTKCYKSIIDQEQHMKHFLFWQLKTVRSVYLSNCHSIISISSFIYSKQPF